MSGYYDPNGGANSEIMRRMFRRRGQGEARQLFPMAPDAAAPMFQPPSEPSGMQQGMGMPPMPGAPPVVPQPAAPAMPPPNPMFSAAPPGVGSMPAGPIADGPGVGGPNPYAMPGPARMAGPPPADGAMSADQLNALVMALMNGGGGDGDIANRLRGSMGMAAGTPQAPGVG